MRRLRGSWLITAAIAALFFVLFAPLCVRFFSIRIFWETISSARTARIFLHTCMQASASTLLCFVLSLAPAYYISRTNNLVSKILESSYFIPFFFPVVSTLIAFHTLFRFLPFDNFSLTAVLTAHLFYNTPVFIKYISQAWKGIDKSLDDHTRLETKKWLDTLLFVVLPHIAKSAARAGFIVFTFCFTSFGIILSLGNLSLTNFELAIYSKLHSRLDISGALSLALLQFLILGLLNFFITKTESHDLSCSESHRKAPGLFTSAIALLFLLFESVVIITAIGSSVLFCINKGKNYFATIISPHFNSTFPVIEALRNSLFISLCTGAAVSILSYIMLKHKSKLVEFFITSLFSVSMAMLSISLIILTLYSNIPPSIMLMIGFSIVTLPVSYSFMQQHVQAFDRDIIQQSFTDGAGSFQAFLHIELPLLLPVFISNFMQVTAITFGEFTISYMFQTGKSFPLISVINYSVNARRLLGESYAINTVSTLIIALIFFCSTLVPILGQKIKKRS